MDQEEDGDEEAGEVQYDGADAAGGRMNIIEPEGLS